MRKRNHVVPVRLNAKELRHLDGQVANDYKKYRTLQVTNYKKKKSMILLRKQKRKRVLLCVG